MKNKKTEIAIIILFLILQTLLYIYVGTQKAYLHIDEVYSYGLANYDKIDIQENSDFFNTWHTKEYYADYLAVQNKDVGNYTPVYENQKNDVHPPLYYLLLRFAMGIAKGHISQWIGITVNIFIYAAITIVMYFILQKILENRKHYKIKALLLAFLSSILLASLSNVVYIRMYALSTLLIVITSYLHMKLWEKQEISKKLLFAIGITVLAGILTHYYYIFYIAMLFILFVYKYIKEKNKKALLYYVTTILLAGMVSLFLFPYSIEHIFFGYRGKGVMQNLKDISQIPISFALQIYTLNYYAFNGSLLILLLIALGIYLYSKIKKITIPKETSKTKEMLTILWLPSLFFFIMATIASPWRVLRYIVPVCGILSILVLYEIYRLLQAVTTEKISNILMTVLCIFLILAPVFFHLEPELLYRDKKEIVQKVSGELNLPTIYLYNTQKGGFLDDILLFSQINESYIAKDISITKNTIKSIVKNKDISKGILLFINKEKEEENEIISNQVKQYLNFNNIEHVKRLSNCDVYYLH